MYKKISIWYMTRLFVLLFLAIFISCQKQLKTHDLSDFKLFVTLENAPFDSLYLFDNTNDRATYIAGKKTHEFTWEITIPDSVGC